MITTTGPLAHVKKTRAPMIWFVVTLVVLSALFIETRGTGRRNTNFFVHGDSNTVGADVFLDGQKAGKIAIANNSGLSGGVFSCHLSSGAHLLEIKKPGFYVFTHPLMFKRQDYLGVELKRKGTEL